MKGTTEERFGEAMKEIEADGPSYLAHGGPVTEQTHATGQVQPERRQGVITWGRKLPLGDCEVQEVPIGRLRFRAVDSGDTIRLSGRSRISLDHVDAQERNQCVLLHVVAGAQWARDGERNGDTHVVSYISGSRRMATGRALKG